MALGIFVEEVLILFLCCSQWIAAAPCDASACAAPCDACGCCRLPAVASLWVFTIHVETTAGFSIVIDMWLREFMALLGVFEEVDVVDVLDTLPTELKVVR